jgi:glycerol-3-phosphate cytidylyltransferase
VLLQGAFDILNYGHIRAFRYAKAQGDYLIVALNTNELIRDYKGREPVMPWSHKRSIIEACRYVDKVVPAREFSPLKLLKRYQVDVYLLSYEWEHTKAIEIAYMKQKGGRVCFSRRFQGVSSSAIKATLLKEHLDAQSTIIQSAAASGRGDEHIRDDSIFGAASANGATVIPLRGRQPRQAGAGVFERRGT